jgi:hypothetical protein
MKRKITVLLLAFLATMCVFNVQANTIKLTTSKAIGTYYRLSIKGNGMVYVDNYGGNFDTERDIELKVSSSTITVTGDVSFLDCSNNQITAVDLSQTNAIVSFRCNNNALTELDISHNYRLESLGCGRNQITKLDVTKNAALSSLFCQENKLTTLDLSKSTKLEQFDCTKNQITSLDVSQTCMGLFKCYNNKITGVNMTNLINSLPDYTNKAKGIFHIVNPPNEGNVCNTSQVAVARAKNWAVCDSAGNAYNGSPQQIVLTTSRKVNDNLTFYMNANGAVTVEGATGTYVANKKIYYHLTSQTVTIKGDVTRLECVDNDITSVDLTNDASLTSFDALNNHISTLDVRNNVNLTYLGCGYNQLTSLDVSKNTQLQELYINNNQMTNMDFSHSPELVFAWCHNNKFTSLDFSKNTKLAGAFVNGNQINSTNMTALVKSLNARPSDNIGVLWAVNPDSDANVMSKAHVAMLNAKNWNAYDSKGQHYAGLNVITLTTSKAVGDSLKLFFKVNGNLYTEGATGTYDSSGLPMNYTLTSQTASFIGDIYDFGCNENHVTSVDVSNDDALIDFYCGTNDLTSLDFTKNPALKIVYCFENKLGSIKLDCPAMTGLLCHNNALTKLDLSKCPALGALFCNGNNIRGANMDTLVNSLVDHTGKDYALIVVKNNNGDNSICNKAQVAVANAKNWKVADNSLQLYSGSNVINMTTSKAAGETLTLSMATGGDIYIEGAEGKFEAGKPVSYKLSSNKISLNGDVTDFSCNDNNITSLDVSYDSVLTKLNCSGNKLSALDLSKNALLKDLTSYNNSRSIKAYSYIGGSGNVVYFVPLEEANDARGKIVGHSLNSLIDSAGQKGDPAFDLSKVVANSWGGANQNSIDGFSVLTLDASAKAITYQYNTGFPGTPSTWYAKGATDNSVAAPNAYFTLAWTTTGIDGVELSGNFIYTTVGAIHIKGDIAGNASVINLAGQQVYCGNDSEIAVPAGMYIVKVNGKAQKVLVK